MKSSDVDRSVKVLDQGIVTKDLELDKDLYDKAVALAEKEGITVNELLSGYVKEDLKKRGLID